MQSIINCPFCNGEIISTAKKCKHCGEWVNQVHSPNHTHTPKAMSSSVNGDERVQCGECNKRMVPRIITAPSFVRGFGTETRVPKKSICPYCAATYREFPMPDDEKFKIYLYVAFFIVFFYLFFYQPS